MVLEERKVKKTALIIAVMLLVVFGTTWAQQELNQAVEQLERNIDALQDTFRMLAEGQQMRETDMENREALILRLRYQMELISRLTDEQFMSVLQELGGDTSTSRVVYMGSLPVLEWSIRADITQSAEEMSRNMRIEDFISAIKRQLGIN